jgi:hypothetical protein
MMIESVCDEDEMLFIKREVRIILDGVVIEGMAYDIVFLLGENNVSEIL